MNNQGCACLHVKYSPEALGGGLQSERWVCDACGSQFVRQGTVESLRQQLGEAQQWVNDLQSGMYINCVYCGHRYGPDPGTPVAMADVLKEHIEKCPKHPMSVLKQQLAEAQAVTVERCANVLRAEADAADQLMRDPDATDLGFHLAQTIRETSHKLEGRLLALSANPNFLARKLLEAEMGMLAVVRANLQEIKSADIWVIDELIAAYERELAAMGEGK